jgi:RimJ/RimL family protein N-acetyltransferase
MTDWIHTELITPRLILRPWREEDAEALCRFASDPLVGPAAGWKPHTDVAYSREVIRTVFSTAEAYAIVLRYDAILPDGECIPAGTPVGNIRILFRDNFTRCRMKENEAFLDFWMARPLWGRRLTPEAIEAVCKRCFRELKLDTLWCSYFEQDESARRTQRKCGFIGDHDTRFPPHPLNGATVEYFTQYPRWRYEEWERMRGCFTHEMHLNEAPFHAIAEGRKTVEMRLYDDKRSLIRVGDEIRFSLEWSKESILTRVESMRYFPNFEALYDALLPTLGKSALGYGEDEIPSPEDMLAYYPKDTVNRYGVVAIEISRIGRYNLP